MSRPKGCKNKPKIKIMNDSENAELAKKVEEQDALVNHAVA